MATVRNLAVQITADGSRLKSEIASAERSIEHFGGTAEAQMKSVASSFNLVAGAAAALGVSLSVRQLVDYTNTWTDLQARVQNATKDIGETDKVMQSIRETARATYSSIEQTAEAFLQNSTVLRELGYNTQQQILLSEALNNALVISGTKGDQAASVMRALSNAMSLGKLSGDQLNSVLQNGGRITESLAEYLGVTTLELKKLGAEGKITGDVIFKALTSQAEKLKSEMEEMPSTIGDALLQVDNAFLTLTNRFNELTGTTDSIAEGILSIVDTINDIDDSTIVALIESIKTLVTVAGIGASLALAKLAVAKYGAVKAALLLNTTAVTTVTSMGMMQVQAAKTTVAMNALGMATRFALGPFGLIAGAVGIAAIAFSNASKEIEETERLTKLAQESVADLTEGFENMGKSALQSALDQVNAKMELLETRANAAREAVESAANSPRWADVDPVTGASISQTRLETTLKVVNPEMDALKEAAERLEKQLELATEATEENTKMGLVAKETQAARDLWKSITEGPKEQPRIISKEFQDVSRRLYTAIQTGNERDAANFRSQLDRLLGSVTGQGAGITFGAERNADVAGMMQIIQNLDELMGTPNEEGQELIERVMDVETVISTKMDELLSENKDLFATSHDYYTRIVEELSERDEVEVKLDLRTDAGNLVGKVTGSREFAQAVQTLASQAINNTARGVAA